MRNERKPNKIKEKDLIKIIDQMKEEQSQVGYALSHDIKESIRNINSFLQLIHMKYEGRLDHGMVDYLQMITNCTERMEDLVNDMSGFIKTVDNPKKEKVNLNKLLDEVVKDLSIEINYSNAQIVVEDLPEINCSKACVKKLFVILIDNALKFKKEDKAPEIYISCRRSPEEVEFSVQDSGIGIDPKFKEAVFNLFRQLHPRGAYSGNGMGLANARKIVEMHEGKIWLETKNVLKTEFKFKLPVI